MPRVFEWLAVGGSTLVLFPLAWIVRALFDFDASEYAVGFAMFYAAYVINDPHFSVTYLLFYKDVRRRALGEDSSRAQRVRFLIAGLVVPIALSAWAAFAIATRSAQTLGWMVQLMFLLVGWHYAKQGFGALTVLSARRGIRFDAGERRVILAHCYAAWAFAWANPASAAAEFDEHGVTYWAPAHAQWLDRLTGGVFAASVCVLIVTLSRKWKRERRLPVTPLLTFVITIWLWTIFTRLDPLVRYVIPALHSIQYMYFVWLLRRNQARALEGPPSFGPPVATRIVMLVLTSLGLAWLLFHGAPSVLDAAFVSPRATDAASRALGATPFAAAFFVIVNIHHYFMDSVIWRRDNADMQYLTLDDKELTR